MDFDNFGEGKPLHNYLKERAYIDGPEEPEDVEKDRLKKELTVLAAITSDIIGKSPSAQRDVGEYYKRYANQHELPDVRDVVNALLKIQKL